MNWHLVTYADEKFKEKQKFINKIHENSFSICSYGREWLESSDLYLENKNLLDNKSGAGWWIWKPYIILDTLNKAETGDLVVYCDCGDMFSPGLKGYVESNIGNEDLCLLLLGDNLNRHYTKRDCFVLMNCDSEDYWNSKQLEAGFMVWKVCDESIRVVSNWLNYCLDYRIIGNEKSELEEEFDNFKEHRNDQSILTNIAITEGLSVAGQEYRKFIECDYDYWYERNEKSGFTMGREIDSFLLSIKNA
jgi:hypothetical protein